MLFSKRLVGTLAVIAAMAIAPAAGASPANPRGLPETSPASGVATPSVNDRALCWLWYHAAQEAAIERGETLPEIGDDIPETGGVGLPDIGSDRDAYNDLWQAYQEAAQNYESHNCAEVLGRSLPDFT